MVIHQPVHPKQHAYQTYPVDSALVRVLDRIVERSLEKARFIMSTFSDIEGAFNREVWETVNFSEVAWSQVY